MVHGRDRRADHNRRLGLALREALNHAGKLLVLLRQVFPVVAPRPPGPFPVLLGCHQGHGDLRKQRGEPGPPQVAESSSQFSSLAARGEQKMGRREAWLGRSFTHVNQKEPSSAQCKIDDGQLCSPILSLMCSIKIYKRSDVHPYLIGI
jgi:hypothetical protein